MEILVERLTTRWGWVALRGVVAMIIGALALTLKASSVHALTALVGFYLIVDGLGMTLSALILLKGTPVERLFLIEGPLSVIAGVISPLVPDLTAIVLVYLWAFWAVATAALLVVSIRHLNTVIPDSALFAGSFALLILVGLIVFMLPISGLVTWAELIGGCAGLYGLAHLGLAGLLRMDMAETATDRQVEGRAAALQPPVEASTTVQK